MALVNSCQLGRKIPVFAKLKGIERNIKTAFSLLKLTQGCFPDGKERANAKHQDCEAR
jgi:hypothetical protein